MQKRTDVFEFFDEKCILYTLYGYYTIDFVVLAEFCHLCIYVYLFC